MKKLALLVLPFLFSCFCGCSNQDANRSDRQDNTERSPCDSGYNRDQMRRNNQ